MAMLTVICLSLVFASGMLCAKLTEGRAHVEKFIAALSLGAMVGVAFLDLIPEIMEERGEISILWILLSVAAGIVVLKVLDHFVPEHEGKEESEEGNMTHIGIMSAVAVVLHNIVEGMTVYSVSSQSFRSGLTLMVGVALHNIPMGALIYSCLKSEKRAKRNIILAASSLSTVLGGVLMMVLSSALSPSFFVVLMSLALGMVMYIIFWELLPQAIKAKERKTVAASLALGLLLVVVASFLE